MAVRAIRLTSPTFPQFPEIPGPYIPTPAKNPLGQDVRVVSNWCCSPAATPTYASFPYYL